MFKLYGIKNCDTVKKAVKSLDSNKVDFEFIDFKKNPPEADDILRWKGVFKDWPLNKRGRTYRALADKFEKASEDQIIKLIQENTSVIKRPILENSDDIFFGFDQDYYEGLIK